MIFDRVNVSPDKTPEENINAIKSWADNLVDSLDMLNNQIEELTKTVKELHNIE